MDRIEVNVLNPQVIQDAAQMAVTAARLTQGGHKIHDMNDFMTLWEKSYSQDFVRNLCALPHPTLQKFAVINMAVVGASRRFLAQITRHQNEVKFMSASLQYSDYSGQADFVVPYDFFDKPEQEAIYLSACKAMMGLYRSMIEAGCDNDAVGYAAPQGLRNVLIISATPYQWKHMISQRICRRNTDETRYVMLLCWNRLQEIYPDLFDDAGCDCMCAGCREGKMSCGNPIDKVLDAKDIIKLDFPLVLERRKAHEDKAD